MPSDQPPVPQEASRTPAVNPSPELVPLFHRLNNQLGIILANAELLEAKMADDVVRARASQIVASVLEAMGTARDIRARAGRPPA